ncbi:MAG: CapA family protein [Tenericutes bacterium]|nr:CapA family protein [Mycoplasmatota bacterium]
MKKKKKKQVDIIYLWAVFFLFVWFCVIFYLLYGRDMLLKHTKVPSITSEVIRPLNYEAKLLMVGDALIHSSVYNDALTEDGNYDFKPMLKYVKPILKSYDLKYYNQETILGGSSLGYSSYPKFNSPVEVGDAFLNAGFNLVSSSNNHTMDKGETGVINSVNYWKSKKNVVFSGQWTSWEERNTNPVYSVNGINYAFFSYTTWTNGLETPVGKEYLNNVYSNEKAYLDISAVKDRADVIIVAMHWGEEYNLDITEEQREIANYLSSLGVNIIIGTHPHVVEPVEYINNGDTLVIYSLGNFISGQIGLDRLTGLMMEVTIKKMVDDDDSVHISIVNPKAELVYTTAPPNIRVYPYSELNDDILLNYQYHYDKYKKIVGEYLPELEWGLTGE